MERSTPVPSQACAGGGKVGYPCVLLKIRTEKDASLALAAVFLHWYTIREPACPCRFPFIVCALLVFFVWFRYIKNHLCNKSRMVYLSMKSPTKFHIGPHLLSLICRNAGDACPALSGCGLSGICRPKDQLTIYIFLFAVFQEKS